MCLFEGRLNTGSAQPFDKALLFDGGSIGRTDLYVNEILATKSGGCSADDGGRDVSWRPSYRESDPLFGHFTRHIHEILRNL